jgi:hypothetical protein
MREEDCEKAGAPTMPVAAKPKPAAPFSKSRRFNFIKDSRKIGTCNIYESNYRATVGNWI